MNEKASVYRYLDQMGLDSKLNGYGYIAEAILYVMAHPNSKMAECYKYISEKNGVTDANIMNGMRYAILSRSGNASSKVCGVKGFVRTAANHLTTTVGV